MHIPRFRAWLGFESDASTLGAFTAGLAALNRMDSVELFALRCKQLVAFVRAARKEVSKQSGFMLLNDLEERGPMGMLDIAAELVWSGIHRPHHERTYTRLTILAI